MFGPAAATALEDLPYDARGLLSGLFEQGYATGYLLAAIFYRAVCCPSNLLPKLLMEKSFSLRRHMDGDPFSGLELRRLFS